MRRLEGGHLIYRRISHIMNGISMSLEKSYLKRKYGKKLVHISFYILDPILFPCPNLGRDIIINRYLCFRMHKLSNIEIKARIIHQNDHIGRPRHDVLLASLHVGKNGRQMQQHRDKPHVGQLFIMLHHCSSHGSHQITAKEAKFSFRVFLFQCSHQVGSMQIARSLANNQIIFHNSQDFSSSIK